MDLFNCQQRPWDAFVRGTRYEPLPLPLVGGSLVSASAVSISSGSFAAVPPPLPPTGGSEGRGLLVVSDISLISLHCWELSQVDQLVNEYKPEYQAVQHIV